MAKKKQNIVIKDEELTPTTIGVYKNETKNPIALFFIIAMFLALLIFLPNVESLYNKYIAKKPDDDVIVPNNNDNNQNNNNNQTGDDEIIKYELSSNPVITKDGLYTVSNIEFKANMLSFSITNNSESTLNLDNYYFELYNDDDTFVERAKVTNKSLEPSASDNYVLTIKSKPTKVVFIERLEENFPKVKVETNDNGEGTLTCSKGLEKYTYSFVNDKLSTIKYEYSANNVSDTAYEVDKANKQRMAQTYNIKEGVTTSFQSDASGYVLTVLIDLSEADISLMDLDSVYKFKTSPSVIKFKQDAKAFSCN